MNSYPVILTAEYAHAQAPGGFMNRQPIVDYYWANYIMDGS